jgi:hypothetical protein
MTSTKPPKLKLLSGNTKLDKGSKMGWLNIGLSFAPNDMSGRQVCPFASKGCKEACLESAGRGRMANVANARIKKTLDFYADKQAYLKLISADIAMAEAWCKVHDFKLAVRLNVLSDIRWENERFNKSGLNMFETYSSVQFVDYTKDFKKMMKWCKGELPSNYHLTFSRSEVNDLLCNQVLENGGNVATVFRPMGKIVNVKVKDKKSGKTYTSKRFKTTDPKIKKRTFDTPSEWGAYKVFNGDNSDLRHLDPKGVIVGLRAKGEAWVDKSGFVVDFGGEAL